MIDHIMTFKIPDYILWERLLTLIMNRGSMMRIFMMYISRFLRIFLRNEDIEDHASSHARPRKSATTVPLRLLPCNPEMCRTQPGGSKASKENLEIAFGLLLGKNKPHKPKR